jgi:hypothetical protein
MCWLLILSLSLTDESDENDGIIELLDLMSLKTIRVHVDRLRKFNVDLVQDEI